MAAHSPLRLVFFGVLALPLLPAAAVAASAVTSQGVTLRSGPADTYGPVAQLKRGDHVDVRQCDGDFCQILVDGKTGWVSAAYLTRSPMPPAAQAQPTVAATTAETPAPPISATPPVAPPAPPPIATAVPKAPEPTPVVETPKIATTAPEPTGARPLPAQPKVAELPPVKPAATPAPKPAAAPKVAGIGAPATPPRPKPRPVLPLPPAYDETAPAIAPRTAEVRPLPGPRPKVNISGSRSRDFALADVPPPPRDIGDAGEERGPRAELIGPVGFGDDWPHRPWRGAAAFESGGAHVCFVDPAAGSGFCVREGDRIIAPHRWARHALELRNPARLNVVVCDLRGDCHTYQSSSRLVLGGRSIAEITVAAPGY